ncbi:MAG: single-stranded DNA-binding protein [Candidatus Omnitrophota bacterium]
MAASLNKVMLMGNLTRDPELRYIPSGQAVTTFTVAVNRVYTSNAGERKEETNFIRVVAWGRNAEICNEYLKKGHLVFVEGRLQTRSWETQDGQRRSTVEIVAQNVQFLTRPSKLAGATPPPAHTEEDPAAFEEAAEGEPQGGGDHITAKDLKPDDEIPF